MGYGSRALELLTSYYEGKITSLAETDNEPQQEAETLSTEVKDNYIIKCGKPPLKDLPMIVHSGLATSTLLMSDVSQNMGLLEEKLAPRKKLPPLLLKLSERNPEALDYLGVSYGMTGGLLKFWKKAGYAPVYLRQTQVGYRFHFKMNVLHDLYLQDRFHNTFTRVFTE